MMFQSMTGICLLMSFILIYGCEKNPVLPNEEELITTLTLTLAPAGGGPVKTFMFRDIDGDGGELPEITFDTLDNTSDYTGRIELLNETTDPVTIVTEEVEEEDEDHQFFYTVAGGLLTITYTDMDALEYPVGIHTIFETDLPAITTLTITLRHLPDKSAPGVSTGNIMNAGGETDIEVTFPMIVQ